MQFAITCAAGLESVLKKEIELAGYKVTSNQQTLIRFTGDQTAIAKINLRSRVWNKLFLELGKKKVSDFDGLFDLVSCIDWKMYVQGNPIVVTAASKRSKLTSTPTIQSICKKAIVKKLLAKVEDWDPHQSASKATLHVAPKPTKWSVDTLRVESEERVFEDPKLEPVEIFIHIDNDECTILLNTTGESLHKRWYKKATGDAPINEALAAWLVLLSWWKFSEPLYDVFCGSGTIAIEAALIAKNIAPGSFRHFAFESRNRYDKSILADLKKNLLTPSEWNHQTSFVNKEHTIIASDIDPEMIAIAQENAKNAWVDKYIQFAVKDIKEYLNESELIGSMVSNPPYGLRLNNIIDLMGLYKTLATLFEKNPKLHGGIITSFEQFEEKKLSGNWKKSPFYNGGEQCRFYKKSLLSA